MAAILPEIRIVGGCARHHIVALGRAWSLVALCYRGVRCGHSGAVAASAPGEWQRKCRYASLPASAEICLVPCRHYFVLHTDNRLDRGRFVMAGGSAPPSKGPYRGSVLDGHYGNESPRGSRCLCSRGFRLVEPVVYKSTPFVNSILVSDHATLVEGASARCAVRRRGNNPLYGIFLNHSVIGTIRFPMIAPGSQCQDEW
mmetsp:Transcript_1263/g.3564  ORF Transcript_1263/g.3564 Transcript_1263/m.3564 type:complete len:200 (-) Transcript_1263:41-640(-)